MNDKLYILLTKYKKQQKSPDFLYSDKTTTLYQSYFISYNIMLSTRSTDSLSFRDPNVEAIIDLEQQIKMLDSEIAPLREKTTKKVAKIEKKLKEINNLIDSNLGSKADMKDLRKTKKELRNQRVQLWAKLEILPALEEQRDELDRELREYRRRHGVLWHEASAEMGRCNSLWRTMNRVIRIIVNSNLLELKRKPISRMSDTICGSA